MKKLLFLLAFLSGCNSPPTEMVNGKRVCTEAYVGLTCAYMVKFSDGLTCVLTGDASGGVSCDWEGYRGR